MPVGIGYDVHKLKNGRKLFLGGAEIPFLKGLISHSDGDVLLHALCDALLGAVGEGDIGKHFPDDNPEYKNISSLILLEKVQAIISKKLFIIKNIDAVIVAEAPKLFPYLEKMKEKIAGVLKLDKKLINIKATTTEGLGFAGRGEGMAAYAAVLLEENQ